MATERANEAALSAGRPRRTENEVGEDPQRARKANDGELRANQITDALEDIPEDAHDRNRTLTMQRLEDNR